MPRSSRSMADALMPRSIAISGNQLPPSLPQPAGAATWRRLVARFAPPPPSPLPSPPPLPPPLPPARSAERNGGSATAFAAARFEPADSTRDCAPAGTAPPLPAAAAEAASVSKTGSRDSPATVGRKKGAASGFFGGSIGLEQLAGRDAGDE
eukprot:280710-Chlamydomonas_euryale.AAC.3